MLDHPPFLHTRQDSDTTETRDTRDTNDTNFFGNPPGGDVWRKGFPEADWSGVRAVIPSLRSGQALSEAKDLCARRARPFAEFTLSGANVLRVTGILSKYLHNLSHFRCTHINGSYPILCIPGRNSFLVACSFS